MSRQIAANPQTKALEAQWSAIVRERDGWECAMEIKHARNYWTRCGVKGHATNPLDAAHIYPRRECAKAIWDPDVGITACRRCHTAYDARSASVRVPPARELAAWARITAPGISKVKPPRRLPEGVRA